MSATACIGSAFLRGLPRRRRTGSGSPVVCGGGTSTSIVVCRRTSGSISNSTSLSCGIIGRFDLSKLVKLSEWNGFTAIVLNLVEPCGSCKI